MKITTTILLSFLSIIYGCFFPEPKYIQPTDTLNVNIQPAEALEIAEPFLKEHATYNWKKDKPLKTHIVKHRKWYYIMRTNYPAKTVRYYMQPAVRVNTSNGEVSFVKRN